MDSGGCEEERVAEKMETLGDLTEEEASRSGDSSSSSDSTTGNGKHSHCCSSESSSSSSATPQRTISDALQKTHLGSDARKLDMQDSSLSEIEMMKERFAKLLLGEDMSGCGNGVTTSLAISNAFTNLCATIFGQLWRLEPLPTEKKRMWKREMEWLLSVSDHIVEMMPTWQTFPDGTKLEIMTCRPRSDLYVNLPALRKLDNMLLEVLDSFRYTEFWYVDQGIVASETTDGSCSFRRQLQRQEEKWWLPVPRVPPGGLLEDTRKKLQHKRECTNQILKAAMAINSITLSDMDVPDSYMENLPKNGRASLGDIVYRYITSDHFSSECLLDCLDLFSEHQAIEIANRVEATIYLWRQKTINSQPINGSRRSASRSSWNMVKELMIDAEKREVLADRAETLLLCLKQRFPGLSQTTLDISKIQYNKDVGKSILESYSRVLESLAFNIVARIDDLLCVDDLTKHSDQFSSIPRVSVIAHKPVSSPYSSASPLKTPVSVSAFTLAKGDRSPFLSGSGKLASRGFGVKKVLTDYLNISSQVKDYASPNHGETNGKMKVKSSISLDVERSVAVSNTTGQVSVAFGEAASAGCPNSHHAEPDSSGEK